MMPKCYIYVKQKMNYFQNLKKSIERQALHNVKIEYSPIQSQGS